MLGKVPVVDFQPNKVVFVKDNKENLKPAKIVMKSGYGTYKIKVYGSKDE